MSEVVGRRVYCNKQGRLVLAPADYGKDSEGRWLIRPPVGDIGEFDDHAVIENSDGTISVSPSIDGPEWHGHLLSGVWHGDSKEVKS